MFSLLKICLKLVIEPLQVHVIKYNYSQKIKELVTITSNNFPRKINIAFLCWERQKWNGKSLYTKFSNDKHFNIFILLVIKNDFDSKHDDNYRFYKQQGYTVFPIRNYIELSLSQPDIIFYEQPWNLQRRHFSLFKVSKKSICLYFPYSIATTIEFPKIFKLNKFFFKSLYKQFVFNSDIVELLKKYNIDNTISTGHPKLDAYSFPVKHNHWHNENKTKIIYAPHHSFDSTTLQWATFRWNGILLLEIAKKHPETEWIFKPHPWFKEKVIDNNIMTKSEIDEYYREWENVGQVYDSGDYFDIFRTSNLLITDCGSFLVEYFPTGNPVIHLLTDNDETKNRNSTYRQISEKYYKVKSTSELLDVFNLLVVKKEDPLKTERASYISNITFNSADNIYNYINREILHLKQA